MLEDNTINKNDKIKKKDKLIKKKNEETENFIIE